MLLTEKTAYSLPEAYTDCSGSVDTTSVTINPKDPDYYSLAAEAMPPTAPNSKESENSSANTDSRKSDVSGTIYPSNHDRMPAAFQGKPSLVDSKGSSQPLANCEPYDFLLPAEGSLLYPKGSAELSQTLPGGEAKPTLLSNGHLTRSPDSLPESSH